MKTKTNKAISLLLSIVMLLLLVPAFSLAAYAEDGFASYEEAADGEILYSVDFRGITGVFAPAKMSGDDPVISEDGRAITMSGSSYFGGEISTLPLNALTTYTITFDLEFSVSGQGAGLYIDKATPTAAAGFNGYYSTGAASAYMNAGSNKSEGYRNFSNLGLTINNAGTGVGKTHTYKIIVDGPNDTLAFFVLLANGKWGHVETTILADAASNFKTDKLNIILRSYLADAKTFSNMKIYKGFKDSISANAPGKVLLNIGDLTQPIAELEGAAYTPGIDVKHAQRMAGIEYSYNADTNESIIKIQEESTADTNTSILFGGTTNLRLGHGEKYTLTYLMKYPGAGGTGLRFSGSQLNSTHGIYMNSTQMAVANGTSVAVNTAAAPVYPYTQFTTSMLEGGLYRNDGYVAIAVEFDGYDVTIYVNEEKLIEYNAIVRGAEAKDSSSNKNIRVARGFSSETMTIAIHDYIGSMKWGQEQSVYKDITIYSGLVISNSYLDIEDGSVINSYTLTPGSEFTLPTVSKAGFVFKGWELDGGAELLDAGGKITLDAPKMSLKAIFDEIQSAMWYQLRDAGENRQDIRIVSIIDSLDYSEIGYKYSISYTENGSAERIDGEKELKYVYTSLSANYGAETVTITELGYQENAGYLTSFVIKNLPVDAGEITIELTPYYIRSGSTEKVYQNSFTQLFTLNDGISA